MMNQGAPQTVNVLAVLPHPTLQARLASILSHSNWRLRIAGSCQEGLNALRSGDYGVVITEYRLSDRMCWHSLLEECRRMAYPPRVVVTARCPDDELWAEVLNLGGYDVLTEPYDPEEVFRVVRLAWLNWRSQFAQEHADPAIAGMRSTATDWSAAALPG